MKKYILTYIILNSAIHAAEKSANLITITNGSKSSASIRSIMSANQSDPNSCNLHDISNKLNSIVSPPKQKEFYRTLIGTKCNFSDIGSLKFGDTMQIEKSPGILIFNKHGLKLCKADMDFAIRTAGKSELLNKLTGGRASGGTRIFCDYGADSANVADKNKLNILAKKRLKTLEYAKENFDR